MPILAIQSLDLNSHTIRKPTATLLVSCPDQVGLIHTITKFLSFHHGNIVQLNKHVESPDDTFFFRVEWELTQFTISRQDLPTQLAAHIFFR